MRIGNHHYNNHHQVTSLALIDLFPSRLIVSFKVYQVVFVRLGYNSALCLASCCFLSHVVAKLICMFLVSRQMVLISNLPKFIYFFLWSKSV
jgi:hypothetical protein